MALKTLSNSDLVDWGHYLSMFLFMYNGEPEFDWADTVTPFRTIQDNAPDMCDALYDCLDTKVGLIEDHPLVTSDIIGTKLLVFTSGDPAFMSDDTMYLVRAEEDCPQETLDAVAEYLRKHYTLFPKT